MAQPSRKPAPVSPVKAHSKSPAPQTSAAKKSTSGSDASPPVAKKTLAPGITAKPAPKSGVLPAPKAKPTPPPAVKSSSSKKPSDKSAPSGKSAAQDKSAKPAASGKSPSKTRPAITAVTKAASAPAKSNGKHASILVVKTAASAKSAPSAKTVSAKTAAPAKHAGATKPSAPAKPAGLKGKDAVRARILAQRAKPAKPSAFSLDEVLAIAKTAEKSAPAAAAVPFIATKSGKTAPLPASALQPPKPTTVRAASLADILGFNPKSRASHAENEEAAIPEKYKRYYKLLIELRNHVTGQVDQHSEETLKRSAKEDSGDLSSYGTDGGTDSFDRDFALSLVANEQEALSEVEAAIQRIKAGTYGICEHTQQPINKDRLTAVPFTRYTAAAMKEIEKTRYKVRGQTGILGEGEEGGPKMESDDGGE